MKLICFDIGGTAVKYGVVENGNILEKYEMPTNTKLGQDNLIKRLKEETNKLLLKYNNIKGVGISTTGNVDFDNKKIFIAPEAIPEFLNFDFKKVFEDDLNLKCIADNDVNSFAAAEMMYGSGKKYNTYLVMTLGTGIGGAIIVDNKMWRGKLFGAGEVGRMLMYDSTYENLASVSALIKQANNSGLNINNGKELFDLYDNNDELAIQVINQYYDYVAYGICSLIYAFNPEAIIIGGGISSRPTMAKEITDHVNKMVIKGYENSCDIVSATFKNDGGMIGAYANFVSVYGEIDE